MSMHADFLSAADMRRWATQCEARARDPMITGDEYERLMRMREALLAVAESQDWLTGVPLQPGGSAAQIADQDA